MPTTPPRLHFTPPTIAPHADRLITAELPILIDTREQLPYSYPGAKRATLATGDYTVEGYESRIAVERKSLQDYLGCVGRGRDRFERELERLTAFDYPAIVIEASLEDFLGPYEISKVHPAAAINSMIAWSIRYGVHVWLAGSRDLAETLTYRLLQHFVRLASEPA